MSSFLERSAEWEIVQTGHGRGVVCFDYDRDGDVDVFVANHNGPPQLFANELEAQPGAEDRHWLVVRLRGLPGNAHAVGARVRLRANGITQLREIRAGSQFMSQAPMEAHFGVRGVRRAHVEVTWPDGAVTVRPSLRLDRVARLRHPLLGEAEGEAD